MEIKCWRAKGRGVLEAAPQGRGAVAKEICRGGRQRVPRHETELIESSVCV